MECKKYEIIEDGGRKRIRSLRDFTVRVYVLTVAVTQ